MSQTQNHDLAEEIQQNTDDLRQYKRELQDRLERAERGEKVGPGEPRELDAIGLAHLSGKISGIDAGLAMLEELDFS